MAIQLSIGKKSILIGCVVFVWRSLKNGKSKGTLSSYFAFLFPQREKRIASSQKVMRSLWRRKELKRTAMSKLTKEDEKRSDRLVEVDDDLIEAIIDSDRHSTTHEIAEKLHVSRTCIENLKQLGYVQKLGTWVPHELKETHLTQRINSCDSLRNVMKMIHF